MPRVFDINNEKIASSIFDVDKFLRQADKGQVQRFAFLERSPMMGYTHYLNTPQGSDVPGGQYECIASNPDKGGNGEECPACAVAEPGFGVPVSEVRPQFIWQLARYFTDSKGKVRSPAMEYGVWITNQNSVLKIQNKMQNADIEQLEGVDLVATSTNPDFKQFDFDLVDGRQIWQRTDEGKASFNSLRSELRPESEIAKLFGRSVDFDALAKAVDATGAGIPFLPDVEDEDFELEGEELAELLLNPI